MKPKKQAKELFCRFLRLQWPFFIKEAKKRKEKKRKEKRRGENGEKECERREKKEIKERRTYLLKQKNTNKNGTKIKSKNSVSPHKIRNSIECAILFCLKEVEESSVEKRRGGGGEGREGKERKGERKKEKVRKCK